MLKKCAATELLFLIFLFSSRIVFAVHAARLDNGSFLFLESCGSEEITFIPTPNTIYS
jgi:hypothetical protein